MPGNDFHILCTRPLPDELLEEMRGSGLQPEVIPFIETEPLRSIETLEEIHESFLHEAVVIFTSASAVDAVALELEEMEPAWQVYCVGAATRKKISNLLGEDHIIGMANSAAELAGLIIGESVADEFIFFCGDKRRDELPGILEDAGLLVQEIIVYETTLVKHKLNKTYQGILFFSPSAVQAYFSYNKPGPHCILFAIGPTTQAEIMKFGSFTIITAEEPSKEDLIKTVIDFYQ